MNTNTLQITPFQSGEEEPVVQLWKDCNLVVPWNDPFEDIRIKLTFQPDLFLVGKLDGRVVATAMAGYDGHRGWINYLAVAPDLQKSGIGREIMSEAEVRLKALGCPKINVQIRTTNTPVIEFYQRIGFSDDNVIGMGKRLIEKPNR